MLWGQSPKSTCYRPYGVKVHRPQVLYIGYKHCNDNCSHKTCKSITSIRRVHSIRATENKNCYQSVQKSIICYEAENVYFSNSSSFLCALPLEPYSLSCNSCQKGPICTLFRKILPCRAKMQVFVFLLVLALSPCLQF